MRAALNAAHCQDGTIPPNFLTCSLRAVNTVIAEERMMLGRSELDRPAQRPERMLFLPLAVRRRCGKPASTLYLPRDGSEPPFDPLSTQSALLKRTCRRLTQDEFASQAPPNQPLRFGGGTANRAPSFGDYLRAIGVEFQNSRSTHQGSKTELEEALKQRRENVFLGGYEKALLSGGIVERQIGPAPHNYHRNTFRSFTHQPNGSGRPR